MIKEWVTNNEFTQLKKLDANYIQEIKANIEYFSHKCTQRTYEKNEGIADLLFEIIEMLEEILIETEFQYKEVYEDKPNNNIFERCREDIIE